MDYASMLTAGVLLAAGLLMGAGVLKVRVPDQAMGTLHRLGLPSGRWAARTVGVGEVVTGLVMVLAGGQLAAGATALVYATFTAVGARQRSAQVDCGCFGGAAGSPVTRSHLAANATFTLIGVAALWATPLSLTEIAGDVGALGSFAAVLLTASGTGLLIASLGNASARAVQA